MIRDKKMCFILSTGRTGTLFFKDYINGTSELTMCVHEPRPSRRFIPLSNMYAQDKVSAKTICSLYAKARSRVFQEATPPIYIESNNFVWACVKALNLKYKDISVLHLVRHPVEYIISHYNHGFWSPKKRLIRKYIPYFVADLPLPQEVKHDPFMILALRWQYINRYLETYAQTNAYLCIKFEDLFWSGEQGVDALEQIRTFMDLEELPDHEHRQWLSKTKNSASKIISEPTRKRVKEICKTYLQADMDKYQYSLD